MVTNGTVTQYVPGKEEWTAYVERLDFYFLANDIAAEAKKRAILLNACGPSTYKLIRILLPADELAAKTYAELVTLVQGYYAPKPSKIMQRFKFNTRTRREGESIAAFVAALREIAEHCEYAATLSEMLRDRIVCGVRHEGIQKRLLAEKELTYKEAYELALSMESAERDTKNIKFENSARTATGAGGEVHFTRTHRNYPAMAPPKRQKEAGKRGPIVCYRCGADHLAPDCPFKGSTCTFCKKVGHIEKACKNKRQKPTSSRAHHVAKVDDDDDNENPYYLFNLSNDPSQDAMLVEVTLNDVNVSMELDTGASHSLINKGTYQRVSARPLQHTNVNLKTYTGESISLLGTAPVLVKHGEKQEELMVYVVDGEGPNIMGRDWLNHFKVSLQGIYNLVGTHTTSDLEEVLSKHADAFSKGLGKLKGFKAKLYIEPGAKPKFCKARTVSWAMKDLVTAELDRLDSEGIISPVQFSRWAAPIVPVMKKDGTVRLCVDYSITVNPVLLPDPYLLPRVEELFAWSSGSKRFTKLDLAQAYLQFEVDQESRELLAINTPKEVFQYNRLPFGVSTAPAIFQRTMESLLKGCKSVCVYIDDILLTGANESEHLSTLDKVLTRLVAAGLKLNLSKCRFMLSKVEYLGHTIDEHGLHPQKKRLKLSRRLPTQLM